MPKFNPKMGIDNLGYLYMVLDDGYIMVTSLIGDAAGTMGEETLLEFVNGVIKNVNKKDTYWGNGTAAQVVIKDGEKMFKIFFHLTDNYEPCFIKLQDFKELLEFWIKNKRDFDKNPLVYNQKYQLIDQEELRVFLSKNNRNYKRWLRESGMGSQENMKEFEKREKKKRNLTRIRKNTRKN